jgi:hypothetical protein
MTSHRLAPARARLAPAPLTCLRRAEACPRQEADR